MTETLAVPENPTQIMCLHCLTAEELAHLLLYSLLQMLDLRLSGVDQLYCPAQRMMRISVRVTCKLLPYELLLVLAHC